MEKKADGSVFVEWSLGSKQMELGLVPAGSELRFVEEVLMLLSDYLNTANYIPPREVQSVLVDYGFIEDIEEDTQDVIEDLRENVAELTARAEWQAELIDDKDTLIADLEAQLAELRG